MVKVDDSLSENVKTDDLCHSRSAIKKIFAQRTFNGSGNIYGTFNDSRTKPISVRINVVGRNLIRNIFIIKQTYFGILVYRIDRN